MASAAPPGKRCSSLLLIACCVAPRAAAGTRTEAALRAMSGEALVQYALQLQGAAAACDPCSPGNPCNNEGTCFIQHATGFIPAGGTRILQTG